MSRRRTNPAQLHFAGLQAAMYAQLADAYDRADAGQVVPLAAVAADLAEAAAVKVAADAADAAATAAHDARRYRAIAATQPATAAGNAAAYAALCAAGKLAKTAAAKTAEAEAAAKVAADLADDGSGDDSDDETSVDWRPSAETMRLFRAIAPAPVAGQVAAHVAEPAPVAAKVAKPARSLWYVVDIAGKPLAGPMTKTAANAFMIERVRSHRANGGTAWRSHRIESFHYYHWSAKDERHADPNWPIYELRRRSAGHTATVDTLTIAPATDAGPGEAPKARHIIHDAAPTNREAPTPRTDDAAPTRESTLRPSYDYHRQVWHPRHI